MIELKIIELVKPTIISHLSKDGLDAASAATIALLALLNKQDSASEDWNTKLFGPTLLSRERTIQPERFERLLSLVVLLENQELKEGKPLIC